MGVIEINITLHYHSFCNLIRHSICNLIRHSICHSIHNSFNHSVPPLNPPFNPSLKPPLKRKPSHNSITHSIISARFINRLKSVHTRARWRIRKQSSQVETGLSGSCLSGSGIGRTGPTGEICTRSKRAGPDRDRDCWIFKCVRL